MALLYRQLDILRVVVAPADDDQVLAAAGDEERVVLDEAEVARTQERSDPIRHQRGVDSLDGLSGAAPVPLGDAGAGDPDLADDGGRAGPATVGVDDQHLLVEDRPPAANQHTRCVGRGFCRNDTVVCKCDGLNGADGGWRSRIRTADYQRSL